MRFRAWSVRVGTAITAFLVGTIFVVAFGSAGQKELDPVAKAADVAFLMRETELEAKDAFLETVINGLAKDAERGISGYAPMGSYEPALGGGAFNEIDGIWLDSGAYDMSIEEFSPRGFLIVNGSKVEMNKMIASQHVLKFATVSKNGIRYEFNGRVAARLTETGYGMLVVTGILKKIENGKIASKALLEFDETGC